MKIRKGAPPKQIRLKRQLGLFDSSMVMVGIGAGEVKIAEKATSALFGGSIGALISAVPIKHGGIPLSLLFSS